MDCTQAFPETQAFVNDSEEECPEVLGWVKVQELKYELKQGELKVGRDSHTCDLVPCQAATLSKVHAVFEVNNSSVTVADLGSRNRTKLNKIYLKPHVRYALSGRGTIRFGNITGTYLVHDQNPSSESDTLLDENASLSPQGQDESRDCFILPTQIFPPDPNPIIVEAPPDFVPETPQEKTKPQGITGCVIEESPTPTSSRHKEPTKDGSENESSHSKDGNSSTVVAPLHFDSDASTDLEDFDVPSAKPEPVESETEEDLEKIIPVSLNDRKKPMREIPRRDSKETFRKIHRHLKNEAFPTLSPISHENDEFGEHATELLKAVADDQDELFLPPIIATLNSPNKENADIFARATQALSKTSAKDKALASNPSSNCSDSSKNVFDQPTQIAENPDVFDQPTQIVSHPKLADSSPLTKEKQKQISFHRPTKVAEDPDVFDQPTQIVSHSKSVDTSRETKESPTKSIFDQPTQFAVDSDVFDQPTQVVSHSKSVDTSREAKESPSQSIFDQPTQFEVDPDVFNQPTQIASHPKSVDTSRETKESPSKSIFDQPTQFEVDPDVFDQPTQVVSHSKSADTSAEAKESPSKSIFDQPTQFAVDSDLFDQPTQPTAIAETETSIFDQPTQVSDPSLISNKEYISNINELEDTQDILNAFKAKEKDLDIFDAPTQMAPPKTPTRQRRDSVGSEGEVLDSTNMSENLLADASDSEDEIPVSQNFERRDSAKLSRIFGDIGTGPSEPVDHSRNRRDLPTVEPLSSEDLKSLVESAVPDRLNGDVYDSDASTDIGEPETPEKRPVVHEPSMVEAYLYKRPTPPPRPYDVFYDEPEICTRKSPVEPIPIEPEIPICRNLFKRKRTPVKKFERYEEFQNVLKAMNASYDEATNTFHIPDNPVEDVNPEVSPPKEKGSVSDTSHEKSTDAENSVSCFPQETANVTIQEKAPKNIASENSSFGGRDNENSGTPSTSSASINKLETSGDKPIKKSLPERKSHKKGSPVQNRRVSTRSTKGKKRQSAFNDVFTGDTQSLIEASESAGRSDTGPQIPKKRGRKKKSEVAPEVEVTSMPETSKRKSSVALDAGPGSKRRKSVRNKPDSTSTNPSTEQTGVSSETEESTFEVPKRRRGRPASKKLAESPIPERLEPSDADSLDLPSTSRSGRTYKRNTRSSTSPQPSPSQIRSTAHQRSSRSKARVADDQSASESSEGILHSGSGRQASASLKPRVMFTGYKDEGHEKLIRKLGGSLVESVDDCSVLVTSGIKRTCKLLSAFGKGIPIVDSQWIISSKRAKSFVDPWDYLVNDPEMEKKYNFKIATSLRQAGRKRLLDGHAIYATKSVKPPPEQFKEIVECAGGTFLEKAPRSYDAKTIVVATMEDKRVLLPLRKLKVPIVSAEFILTGLLQQKISVGEFAL